MNEEGDDLKQRLHAIRATLAQGTRLRREDREWLVAYLDASIDIYLIIEREKEAALDQPQEEFT